MSDWGVWGKCGELNTGGQLSSVDDIQQEPPCGNGLKMRFQFFISKPQYGKMFL